MLKISYTYCLMGLFLVFLGSLWNRTRLVFKTNFFFEIVWKEIEKVKFCRYNCKSFCFPRCGFHNAYYLYISLEVIMMEAILILSCGNILNWFWRNSLKWPLPVWVAFWHLEFDSQNSQGSLGIIDYYESYGTLLGENWLIDDVMYLKYFWTI